jgi:hypothetical protein
MSASWGSARFTPRGGGSSAWIELVDADFTVEADQNPSAATLTFGGITWTVEGGANDVAGGPKILSGVLLISPDIATNVGRSSSSKRSAPILHSTLSNLGAPFSSLGTNQILVNVEISSWSPAATQEAIRVGVENSTNPIGSGSNGRGVTGGTAFQTTQRAGSVVYQDSGGTGNVDSTATLAVRSLACLFSGPGVSVYSSATPGALDSPEKILAASPAIMGGSRGSPTVSGRDRLIIVGESPDASSGPAISISSIKIWARE